MKRENLVVQLAGCVVKNSSGKILLIHRNTARFVHWELPGGKVEPGEKPDEAAIRELAEETGIQAEIVRNLGTGTFQQAQDGKRYAYFWYLADAQPGVEAAPLEPHIHDKVGWFTMSEIKTLDHISANLVVLLETIKEGAL